MDRGYLVWCMRRNRIVPAAGFHFLTPFNDAVCAALGYGARFRDGLVHDLAPAPGERILDIGCGTGVLAARIASRVPGARVVGIDPDARAQRLTARRARAAVAGVSHCVAPGERLPFADSSFDRIVSSLALHHVPDAAKARVLQEARRVLSSGGTLLLADFDTALSRFVFRGRRSGLPIARFTDPATRPLQSVLCVGVIPSINAVRWLSIPQHTHAAATRSPARGPAVPSS